MDKATKAFVTVSEMLAEKDRQIAELREVLGWYAQDSEEESRKFHFGLVKSNIGERARKALKAVTHD